MSVTHVLIALALAVVVAVLATGVTAFVKGGPWYDRNANRLLQLRVAAQAAAVLLLALLAWLGHKD